MTGIYFIAAGLVALAIFPFLIFSYFQFVILDQKRNAVVADLSTRGTFEIEKVPAHWKSENSVRSEVDRIYSAKRYLWSVLLLVFFNLICFSIVWDIVHFRWASDVNAFTCFYSPEFLTVIELPIVAYLGVTIFNYGHMLRRLYVWDLTPHVFWNAIFRIWLVFAVAVVCSVSTGLYGGPGALGKHLAFFALGFIINSTLLKLIERAQSSFGSKRAKAEDLPLSLIQGISFWHEYRLEEEGIENVQNLATCDAIELAVNTRYNLRTIIDWVDQAVLVHRVGQKAILLRQQGLISGAIDLAWASPANSDNDKTVANEVAKTLGTSPVYVSTLMDSLYDDSQVSLIWELWQSGKPDKAYKPRK